MRHVAGAAGTRRAQIHRRPVRSSERRPRATQGTPSCAPRHARVLSGRRRAASPRSVPGRQKADLLFTLPKQTDWDLEVLTRYIRHTHPPVQRDMLIGSVRRRGGAWGAIARRASGSFVRSRGSAPDRTHHRGPVCGHSPNRPRPAPRRTRSDRQEDDGADPSEGSLLPDPGRHPLADALRSLVRAPHPRGRRTRRCAWWRNRSRGRRPRASGSDCGIPITDDAAALLQSQQVYGFDRHGDRWREWRDQPAGGLAALLDYNSGDAADGERVREASMLCVPLVTRDSLVGVLKIAARYPEQLKPFDAEMVEHFRSQAAIAIQNLHRTESLRARVVTAERKHAMADLARSVSHDVNNALGSMLPLIQQMQVDLHSGTFAPAVFAEDLEHVQKSLQVCRRIFGGMLTFSRNAARRSRDGQVRRAIETASAILKYGMSRSAIELHVDIPDDDAGSRLQPERSRTGVSEPAHQRTRGDAARRTDHGHRPSSRSRRGNLHRRYRMRDRGENIFRGCSSRSSRRSHTATASACRSAARCCGKWMARSRFGASPATARTSMCSSRRRYRSRTHSGHETGTHPGRGRRTGHASRRRARAEQDHHVVGTRSVA